MKDQQQAAPARGGSPKRKAVANPSLEGSNSMAMEMLNLSPEELLHGPVSDLSENPHVTTADEGKYEYQAFEGPVASRGKGDYRSIDANDVEQNYLGDCYLIAAMGAVARAQPSSIADLIKDNKDGTYDVSLWVPENRWSSKRIKKTVTVDNHFPATKSGAPAYAGHGDKSRRGVELWPMLLEKAYALHMGSYGAIEGGYSGDSMEMLTNKNTEGYDTPDMGDEELLDLLAGALKGKQSATCEVTDDKEWSESEKKVAEKHGIIGNHAYALEGVSKKGRTIDVQNPWGINHIKGLPIAVFKQFFTWVNVNG